MASTNRFALSAPYVLVSAALFGYGGLEIARLALQPLSTTRTPRIAMGKEGANHLLSGRPSTIVDVGFELVAGMTT